MKTIRKPSWQIALIPIVSTLAILMLQILMFNGAPHVPLILGIGITAVFGIAHGHKWSDLQDGMLSSVAVALPVLGIFMVVGMTIGTWIASGTVPLLTKIGLEILTPAGFLPLTCIICAIVSVFTGTSWGTVGTIGLALLGIGESLGIPSYFTAGAIVSGAWFGDKMSPLSDTTNFTAAITGTNLYTHMRNMLPTTLPALVISLIIYSYLGNTYTSTLAELGNVETLDRLLTETFVLNIWVLFPPLVIAMCIWKKVEPMPCMFLGVFTASAIAFFVQDMSLNNILQVMMNGYISDTGNSAIDSLLSKGGIMSMTWVITLIMIAMAFGGVLQKTGCFDAILASVMPLIKGRIGLVFATMFATVSFNFASNAFIAYTIPGRMFTPAFRGQGLSSCNVSRILEDGATMSAPLIPWNSGAVFVSSTLGIPTLLYAPFAFCNWISFLFNLFWGITGWFIPKASEQEIQTWCQQKSLILHGGVMEEASPENTKNLIIYCDAKHKQ
ncbi:Na+/H+ antiporter NhaC [Paraglaciecola sp. 2405UD69-4]|uniref:Na+/H+ antiporter NhaC n=1 Tax=Paraglaciecola sp. 2405UD69-4 TaxID=3391836 RepID=UPI0039C90202